MSRRKKTPQKKHPVKEEVVEWDGWRVGDLAYGKTWKTEKTVYGEIKQFWPKDEVGPAVTLVHIPQGYYVTVLVSSLTEKDPKKIKIIRKKPRKSKKSEV